MPEYREAFALFDKKGTGEVPRESLGELLRSLGQNPTQAEVSALEREIGATCEYHGKLDRVPASTVMLGVTKILYAQPSP